MKRKVMFASLIGLALWTACAEKAPDGLIARAGKYMDQAKKSEADRYAPARYAQADSAFERGMEEVDLQNDKKPMHRSYSGAIKSLRSSIRLAENARREAEARKAAHISSLSDKVARTDSIVRDLLDRMGKQKWRNRREAAQWDSALAIAITHLAGARKALETHKALEGISMADSADLELSKVGAALQDLNDKKTIPRPKATPQ